MAFRNSTARKKRVDHIMSKTVFEHVSEQIDQVVRGRRFIIAEIGKLKVTVEDLKTSLDASSMGDIALTVSDLKSFIAQAVTTLGDLKNNISQLSSSISSLNSTVDNTYQVVKSIKASGFSAGTSGGPSYAAQHQAPKPSFVTPKAEPPKPAMNFTPAPPKPNLPPTTKTATAPSSTSSPPPRPAPSSMSSPPQSSSTGGSKFDNILESARKGTPSKDLGVMIDQLRSELSSANPLNPILFELSMEAGRLKSLGGKPLDPGAIQVLQQKITKWKSKS